MDEWRVKAACQDVPIEVMVPASELNSAFAEALTFCDRCEVREACLDDALENRIMFGALGGTTPKQRRRLLNRRARERRVAA